MVVFVLAFLPLVKQGLVFLFPDPYNFDFHLRDQMFEMDRYRLQGMKVDPKEKPGVMEMMKEDHRKSMLLSREALRHQVFQGFPELDERAMVAFRRGNLRGTGDVVKQLR